MCFVHARVTRWQRQVRVQRRPPRGVRVRVRVLRRGLLLFWVLLLHSRLMQVRGGAATAHLAEGHKA